MAEIAVTVSAGGTPCPIKDLVVFASASFNHAALVAAGRSRADGKDFWMYHTNAGRVSLIAVQNPNTATTEVLFSLSAALNAGDSDNLYRLVFGDLGATSQTLIDDSVAVGSPSVSAYTVPALTLPPPSFPLTQVSAYETKAVDYPDFAVFRRAPLNENRRNFVRAEWRNISPEDWYEIRAVVRASRGGVGTVAPSWLTGSYRVRPGSPSFTQDTKGKFSASLELEQALI